MAKIEKSRASVGTLLNTLRNAVAELESLDEDAIIDYRPNTYGLYPPYIATDMGFVELNNITVEGPSEDYRWFMEIGERKLKPRHVDEIFGIMGDNPDWDAEDILVDMLESHNRDDDMSEDEYSDVVDLIDEIMAQVGKSKTKARKGKVGKSSIEGPSEAYTILVTLDGERPRAEYKGDIYTILEEYPDSDAEDVLNDILDKYDIDSKMSEDEYWDVIRMIEMEMKYIGKSKTKKYLPAETDEYATADEVASDILNNIDGIEHIEAEPYHGYGHDDVDVRVWIDEYTDIQDVVDAIDYPDVVDLEDNQDGSYTFTVITGYELNKGKKSKTRKGETKIPVSEDDTVEIEEMDGRRYVEIEPKDEHAEEVATGYEQEGDDLNTEENITRPDTSKQKKSKSKMAKATIFFKEDIKSYFLYIKDAFGSNCVQFDWNDDVVNIYISQFRLDDYVLADNFNYVIEQIQENENFDVIYFDRGRMATVKDVSWMVDAKRSRTGKTKKSKKSKTKKSAPVRIQSFPEGMKKCTEYQFANKRNSLMESEIEDIIGTDPKRFLADAIAVGKAQRIKCSDGYAYRFKM